MTLQTFSPPVNPVVGMESDTEARVNENEFGDGYVQAVGDGINTLREAVPLTFEPLDLTDADEIIDFFIEHAGRTIFFYTLPGESTAKKWRCKKWKKRWLQGENYSVSATFIQQFSLDEAS